MTAANISLFIRGAHHLAYRPDGLVRPVRMSDKQIEAVVEAGRKTRAEASAGVTIDLVTTGDEVSFDLAVLNPLDPADGNCVDSLACRRPGDAREIDEGLVDGIDLMVDGVLVRTVPAREGCITLHFENPAHAPAEVRIYLPVLMSVAVGNLATNGTISQAPERDYLLALGDSITQGYIVGSPSMSWPAQLSRALGLDLVNQAIAGHHFDKATLRGMRRLRENPPALIVIAYGTNDWAHCETARELRRNMAEYLERVVRRFPGVPIYVTSPIWRADVEEPRPCGKPLAWVREQIREQCEAAPELRFVDCAEALPHETSLFTDGRLHPNAQGAAMLCRAVLDAMAADGFLSQVTTAGRRDTAAGRADDQTLLRPDAPGTHAAFDEVVRTIWRLRRPDGCPWDREQTHASISKNMIEEAYEAVDAIEAGDDDHLREELGDVLMQVLLHAQIAADEGAFTIDDVCRDLDEKLVRRHPHVFGARSGEAHDADDVLAIWSDVKLEERRKAEGEKADAPAPSLLDAVPHALPALMQAQKVSKKAAACGFEWESVADVWDKVDEERAEFAREPHGGTGAGLEFGDLLFALVNVARKEGIDAETALRASCDKFRRRWASMEAAAAGRDARLEDLAHEELEELWAEAKKAERGGGSNLV